MTHEERRRRLDYKDEINARLEQAARLGEEERERERKKAVEARWEARERAEKQEQMAKMEALKRQESTAERKRNTRKKILAGTLALNALRDGSMPADVKDFLKNALNEKLTQPRDRKLFDFLFHPQEGTKHG